MAYTLKEGTTLLVVDRDGKQLFSMDMSGRDTDDPEAIREIGKSVCEGIPNEAYTGIED